MNEDQTYLCSLQLRCTHGPINAPKSIPSFWKQPQHGFLRKWRRTGAGVGIGTGSTVEGEAVVGAMVGGDEVVGEGVVDSEQLSVDGRLGSCLLSQVVITFHKYESKEAGEGAEWTPMLREGAHIQRIKACVSDHAVQADPGVTLLLVVFSLSSDREMCNSITASLYSLSKKRLAR